mmetsp:Transcript_19093/g.28563  ORF Transcript_19093/g.28563 Transcript_19093/m.28563 type:complete len:330 (+) Transcript_19093:67-1056(+)|eukprot:CAMPEP_0167744428 /NCGR_PEP_ID=MMETSP0110_2-20121227/2587_1 /TAXON_ID=629695 /ORGANISM="Gymnochlora sp., Strain CCMP2014" /LENGTH=329 /DNA_ID=CAMNT_0007628951 /DNA_START=65 /DNA_END=1054 /DNA_ORIENTATION=-
MNSEYASFGKSRKRCNLAAASIAINAVLLIAGLIAFMNMPADLGRAMTTGSRAQTRAFAAPKINPFKGVAAGLAAAGIASLGSMSQAYTFDEFQGLSYLDVKGSGMANTCPVLSSGTSDVKGELKPGTYKFDKFCIEPSSFQVKEDVGKGKKEFINTKLMTRLTYTLDAMSGSLKVGSGGAIEFKEEDGIDYAPTTVQLPGGSRVPFLFTVKELEAKGDIEGFSGEFSVPSYRGSTFLDPKGRGAATGYDTAVAIPAGGAGDEEELTKENMKSIKPLTGKAVLSIAKYDPATGEIAGVFQSIQPSDTDLGAKVPKDIKVQGLWYAQLSQ